MEDGESQLLVDRSTLGRLGAGTAEGGGETPPRAATWVKLAPAASAEADQPLRAALFVTSSTATASKPPVKRTFPNRPVLRPRASRNR